MKRSQKRGQRAKTLRHAPEKVRKDKTTRKRSRGIGEKLLLALLAVFLVLLLVFFLVR